MLYFEDHSRQRKILQSCHVDATAVHMREKKAIAQISELFVCARVDKAVKRMVETIYYVCMYLGFAHNPCHINTAIRLSKHLLAIN